MRCVSGKTAAGRSDHGSNGATLRRSNASLNHHGVHRAFQCRCRSGRQPRAREFQWKWESGMRLRWQIRLREPRTTGQCKTSLHGPARILLPAPRVLRLTWSVLPACARSRSRTSEPHEFSHAKIDIQCTRNSANFAEAIQSILAYEKLPSRAPPTHDSSLSMDNEREIHQLADQSIRNSEIPLKAEQPTWSRLTWRYCARECMQRAAKASSMEGARQSDGKRRNCSQIECSSVQVYDVAVPA